MFNFRRNVFCRMMCTPKLPIPHISMGHPSCLDGAKKMKNLNFNHFCCQESPVWPMGSSRKGMAPAGGRRRPTAFQKLRMPTPGPGTRQQWCECVQCHTQRAGHRVAMVRVCTASHTHPHTQTHPDTQTPPSHTDTHPYTDTYTLTHTHTHTHRASYTQTHPLTHRHAPSHTDTP